MPLLSHSSRFHTPKNIWWALHLRNYVYMTLHKYLLKFLIWTLLAKHNIFLYAASIFILQYLSFKNFIPHFPVAKPSNNMCRTPNITCTVLRLATQRIASMQPTANTQSRRNFEAVITASRWNNSCSRAMSVREDQLFCLRYEMSEKHKLESGIMFVFLKPKVMKCTPFTASSNPARDDSYMSHQGKRTEFWDIFVIKMLRFQWEL